MTFAFACLIRFYKGTWNGQQLPIKDSEDIVDFFKTIWKENDYQHVATSTLANTSFWDNDLNTINDLTGAIAFALKELDEKGVEKAFESFSQRY